MSIGVPDNVHALLRTIAHEVNGALIKIFFIRSFIYDVGLYGSNLFERTVKELSVDLHSACIEHRTEQGIVVRNLLLQQYRDRYQLQSRHRYQFHIATITHTFGHTCANKQARVRTGTRSEERRVGKECRSRW